MANYMFRAPVMALCLAAVACHPAWPALAETCDEPQFAAVVDRMTGELRDLNAQRQGELRHRLGDLARRRGWPEEEAEARALSVLQSGELKALEARAGQLLVRIDELGDTGAARRSCRDLDELKRAAAALVETTKSKLDRVASRLDELLAVDEAKSQQARVAGHAEPAVKTPPAHRPLTAQAPGAPPRPPAPRPVVPSWQTSVEAPPEVSAALRQLPPVAIPADATFSAEDVQAAGRGLFGTLSAELASVIQFAFQSYGRPNGYILGQEGGAAFLAGLRYGSGTLVTRSLGTRKVYWQGPSVGFDFGVAGSRTMILVYNLARVDQLDKRFVGADGAAFLVGGAGITFLKRGPVVLAPIRTGLGVRVGASVGYMRFSERPSLNPL